MVDGGGHGGCWPPLLPGAEFLWGFCVILVRQHVASWVNIGHEQGGRAQMTLGGLASAQVRWKGPLTNPGTEAMVATLRCRQQFIQAPSMPTQVLQGKTVCPNVTHLPPWAKANASPSYVLYIAFFFFPKEIRFCAGMQWCFLRRRGALHLGGDCPGAKCSHGSVVLSSRRKEGTQCPDGYLCC